MDKCNLLDFYNIKSFLNDELWEFVTTPGPLIYRIYNVITCKSYIGFTKIHLHSRFFTGWRGGHFGYYENPNLNHHLYKSMRKYGLDKFTLEILKLNPEEGDEERFIREYDSYNNGYNLSINGLGYTYEGEYMQFFNKITHEQVKVRDFEADKYLQDENWERGDVKGRVSINKDGINKMIFPDELDKYKSEGWKIGQGYVSSSKGRIHVTDGIHNKMIYPEDLQRYEYDGWRAGRTMNKRSKGK